MTGRTPLIQPVPQQTRIDKKLLFGAAMLLIALGGGIWWWQKRQAHVPLQRELTRPIPEASTQGDLRGSGTELMLPTHYGHLKREESGQGTTPPSKTARLPKDEPLDKDLYLEDRRPRREPPDRGRRQRQAQAQQDKPKPSAWLFPDASKMKGQQPPFPEEEKEKEAQGQAAAKLFPKAVWATPEHPERVWYSSMVVQGLLLHDMNSDIPGMVRVLVTEDLQDRWQQGNVLIPQFSLMLGHQEGEAQYGNKRMNAVMTKIELPDGTDIALNQAQMGDQAGAAGVEAHVDNHYVQLGLSVLLTTALSVGSRSVGGNSYGYQPTIPQEFAKDMSSSVNQTGQDLVRRALTVRPTLRLDHATPVTISPKESISFMTKPLTVRK